MLEPHNMKRLFFLILGLAALLAGCQEKEEVIEETSKKLINISLLDATSTQSSFTVSISAKGVYLADYDKWGIVFSETTDKSQGIEMVAEGKPSGGKKKVKVSGLKKDTPYYVWGWAEGPEADRMWTNTYLAVKTMLEMDPVKLKGTVIGTEYSVNYDTGEASLTVNTKDNVFDGDYNTYFASYDRSGTWVGLDLGTKHIIRKVGYVPRPGQEGRVELAVIEGANKPDFSDALPIHIIRQPGREGTMLYGDINCSRGFRYVRYVSPNDVRCNLAELEFHGYEGDGDDSRLFQFTNLPTVVINTEGAQDIVSKEYEIPSNVYIISDNGTKMLATSDTGVRGRGNASWLYFDKKPYRIKFSEKQNVLDAPAKAKKWTLISNFSDKSLMRNILAFEVSRRVGHAYTPYCRPVDLVVNGEYRGCYQLCDQVEAASDRVPAKDGYLIEVDSYGYQETLMFYSWNGTPVTIKHPDEDDITDEQTSFIHDFYSRMEAATLSSDFTDPVNGYRKYLDVDSFLRQFLIGEFCGNPDMLWSVYMYKDASNGKLHAGPVWDHDIAFDNDYTVYPINGRGGFLYCNGARAASDAIWNVTHRIVTLDPEAKKRMIELWENAYDKGGLKDLPLYLDQTYALLQESQELNFKRWNNLDQKVHMNFQALGSYEKEVQYLRNVICERLELFGDYVRN